PGGGSGLRRGRARRGPRLALRPGHPPRPDRHHSATGALTAALLRARACADPSRALRIARMAAAWVYALAWSALALVYATSFVMSGASPLQALRGVAASIAPNALLGIVTLRLARRFFASDDGG